MRSCCAAALIASSLHEGSAFAQAAPNPASSEPNAAVEGVVLAVQGNDLILDLSEAQGVAARSSVELWRPLTLKHPVTGKLIKDRFRIGALTITQVRPSLSLAVAQGQLERAPEPGDVVIATPSRLLAPASAPASDAADALSTAPDVTAPAATAGAPRPSGIPGPRARDADAAALSQLFDSLRGATPERRISSYATFIKANPSNRYSAALLEQARQLRDLVLGNRAGKTPAPKLQHHTPPSIALVGRPLTLGVQLDDERYGVLIHYKKTADATYDTHHAVAAGDRFFTLKVPGNAIADGGFQYFVEAADEKGQPVALVGTAEAPVKVQTRRDWDLAGPERPDATAQLTVDYADYNRLRGNDRDWRMEADFGLRLNDVGLRALRSGFGVYRGVGGTLADLDDLGKSARAIGLTYGYIEAEYATDQSFAFIARTLLGLDDNGVNGGLQAHVRIGSDRATNVTLGGEVLGNVGLRGITQLSLAPLSDVPVILRSEVGNQPAGVVASDADVRPLDEGATVGTTSTGATDVGVRGIAQVGYRFLPELIVSVRASYQGRNIKHSGPGFGASVLYTW
jgi:hypothetical protein